MYVLLRPSSLKKSFTSSQTSVTVHHEAIQKSNSDSSCRKIKRNAANGRMWRWSQRLGWGAQCFEPVKNTILYLEQSFGHQQERTVTIDSFYSKIPVRSSTTLFRLRLTSAMNPVHTPWHEFGLPCLRNQRAHCYWRNRLPSPRNKSML